MKEKQLAKEIEQWMDKKDDFDEISFIEKIKYMAYFYICSTKETNFNSKQIKDLFKIASINSPANIADLLNKLQKKNVIIKVDGNYRLHRSVIKELDKEFEKNSQTNRIENPLSRLFDLLDIHPKIREVSEKRFIKKDFSVAIEKAFKRIIKLVQEKSKEQLDGTKLMEKVFSVNNPILSFNNLQTTSEKDEQQGMMDLYRGSVKCIRNVRFHEEIEEDEETSAFHLLIFASFLAKKLDESHKVST